MKLIWKGKWKNGEIIIEAKTFEELNNLLDKLFLVREHNSIYQVNSESFPTLPERIGCSEAIRTLLQTEWGKSSPRSMAEIRQALEANALYFTKGSLSGTLTLMVKRGKLKRFRKNGKWMYTLK